MTLVRMRALRVCSTAPPIKATAPTHMKWAGAVAGWTGLLSFHESYASYQVSSSGNLKFGMRDARTAYAFE
jgi:hypothetical protein